jgi:hypothetical protein
MKKSIAICSTILSLLVAFWFGESGWELFLIYPYLLSAMVCILISYLASNKWKYRIPICIIFIVLYSAAFYTGILSFTRSFNVCIDDAEGIREILSDYKAKNGSFPETLHELNIELPCSRVLRGSILQYERTETGYRIWFNDWLVEHLGTESEPFIAHK